jgi:hypothetical protein
MGLLKIVLLLFALALLVSCRGVVVEKPESARETLLPSSPGTTYVWVNDSWNWNNQSRVYVIQPGYWIEPKKGNLVWVDGRWVKKRGGWKYVKGHWKQK